MNALQAIEMYNSPRRSIIDLIGSPLLPENRVTRNSIGGMESTSPYHPLNSECWFQLNPHTELPYVIRNNWDSDLCGAFPDDWVEDPVSKELVQNIPHKKKSVANIRMRNQIPRVPRKVFNPPRHNAPRNQLANLMKQQRTSKKKNFDDKKVINRLKHQLKIANDKLKRGKNIDRKGPPKKPDRKTIDKKKEAKKKLLKLKEKVSTLKKRLSSRDKKIDEIDKKIAELMKTKKKDKSKIIKKVSDKTKKPKKISERVKKTKKLVDKAKKTRKVSKDKAKKTRKVSKDKAKKPKKVSKDKAKK